MIIIADSGSTKTDWVLATSDGSIIARQQTEGINPVHQSANDIAIILSSLHFSHEAKLSTPGSDMPPVTESSIFFYGSGLRPEFRQAMRSLLSSRFHVDEASVVAESDMLGAARSLCHHSEGIACILGTGANSCLYDGSQIVTNTPPLGYILGDEGSGAVIGRNLINALYKGLLPQDLREAFEQEYHFSMADVIARVYREPLPNRWLASLSPFICKHLPRYPELSDMLINSFTDFLRRNILPYQRQDLPLSAIGSIAYYYQTELAHAAALEGLRIGHIERSPIEGLIRYHCT
jgi:N-acetylglucosamine kinase-like BadF-type ATPase